MSERYHAEALSGGAEVLVVEVGVADVGFGEVTADEGLDDGGVDAHGDMAADSLFGPVADGPQMQEVFEGPEAGLDDCELAVALRTAGVLGGGVTEQDPAIAPRARS